ncbi:zinc-binding dehydrogenase [Frigidibacter sp. MR17.24]|uniref:zinc-binding dehydrogenase n=1 Tax=Frigidibacter sp. MR17.24 TaxID=3127345 RepID=UPI003012DF01
MHGSQFRHRRGARRLIAHSRRCAGEGALVAVVAFFDGDEAERHGVTVKRVFTVPDANTCARIGALVEAGKVTPHIERILGMTEVRDALARLKPGARGKIVLQCPDVAS